MLEKIGKDLEKTNAKEELFSLRKKIMRIKCVSKENNKKKQEEIPQTTEI